MELLKEAVPTLSRVAVLWNAADPGMVLRFREIEAAAPGAGRDVAIHEVRTAGFRAGVYGHHSRSAPDALFVVAEVLTLAHRCQVLDLRHSTGCLRCTNSGCCGMGALMAYGPKLTDSFQRGAYYVDRILKGTKPVDLPVEQPMNFELVINFKAAEALGLTIPPHLLVLADRGDRGQENRCMRIW